MLARLARRSNRVSRSVQVAAAIVRRTGTRCFASAEDLALARGGQMFDKILIANRGEIACRVIRSARSLGVKTVAVYSDADANAMHVQAADEAVRIGPPAASQSYLRQEAILEACSRTGAQAVHPGYGFMSENSGFAEACAANGIVFIGPPKGAIESMGSKSASKSIMTDAGVPCTPGYHGDEQSDERLLEEAKAAGFPVMIKAVMGGGGKGMRAVLEEGDFLEALHSCRRESKAAFGDDNVLVERFLPRPRHVEFQVFADLHGNAVHLLERDCSVQRRHQKVLEEAPAPGMTEELRADMGKKAVDAAKAVGYVGAGTVEFMVDGPVPTEAQAAAGEPASLAGGTPFFFMEMNTRLQVEHPVTEMITGVDLVEWQLRVACGQPLPLTQDEIDASWGGHAIEARVYAEQPAAGFLPATGTLHCCETPDASVPGVRVDTGVGAGHEVSIHYDPMVSKVIARGEDRRAALTRLDQGLARYRVAGLPNNIAFLRAAARHSMFAAGGVDTSFLAKHLTDILPQAGGDQDQGADPVAVARARPATALASIARMLLAQARAEQTQEAASPGWSDDVWSQGDGHRPIGAPQVARFEYGFGAEAGAEGGIAGCSEGARVQVSMAGGRFVPGDATDFRVTVSGAQGGDEASTSLRNLRCEVEALTGQELDAADTSSVAGPGLVRIRGEAGDGASFTALVVALPLPAKGATAQEFAVFCDGLPASQEAAAAVRGDDLSLSSLGGSAGAQDAGSQPEIAFLDPCVVVKAPLADLGAGGAADSAGAVVSPMPGKVVSVSAAAGQAVQAGDTLVVLEAMKMEHNVKAPRDVVVKAVHVSPEQQVADGEVMVEFEGEADE